MPIKIVGMMGHILPGVRSTIVIFLFHNCCLTLPLIRYWRQPEFFTKDTVLPMRKGVAASNGERREP